MIDEIHDTAYNILSKLFNNDILETEEEKEAWIETRKYVFDCIRTDDEKKAEKYLEQAQNAFFKLISLFTKRVHEEAGHILFELSQNNIIRTKEEAETWKRAYKYAILCLETDDIGAALLYFGKAQEAKGKLTSLRRK